MSSVPEPDPLAKTDRQNPVDEAMDHLAANWETFRAHRPAGAYLPVGQMDGDCNAHNCGGPWPCPTARSILTDLWLAADLHGWDRGFDAGSRVVERKVHDALRTIETNDSVQSGGYGQASRDAVDLIAHRVLGKRWPRG